MATLAAFIYLQLLDILTTVAFMMQGVGESNPIIRWVIREGPHPIGALFLVKGGAVLLALFCLYRSKGAIAAQSQRILRLPDCLQPGRPHPEQSSH